MYWQRQVAFKENGWSVLTGLFAFPKQQQPDFIHLVRSNQFIFVFIERALRKRDSGGVLIAPFDRLLMKQSNREGQAVHGHSFCGSRSHERARRSAALVSRLEDGGVTNTCFSIASVKGLATGIMKPEIYVSINPFLPQWHRDVVSLSLKSAWR